MPLLPSDQHFLHQSLELAEAAAAFASPNPTVGCVLTKSAVVLGEGAHWYEQRDHAEVAALKQTLAAGVDVHGATAYVTLEPCSHHGRTGPCADALIAAGIKRCVVATIDPNPLVGGKGIAKLEDAGVEVDLLDTGSSLAQRARRLNDAFAFSVQHGRPFVTLKAAVSHDGKLAPATSQRLLAGPFWLTGVAARQDVQHLRHGADAILTGIGTVLADDPSLTDRTGLPRRRPLLRVVLDAELRTPSASKLVTSAQDDLLLLASHVASLEREANLRARGATVMRLPAHDGRLDLEAVMEALNARSIRSLLVECGSTLNGTLLQKDLVDKVLVYTAPVDLGSDALPFTQGFSLESLKARLTGPEIQSFQNGSAEDIRLSGYLHDPWLAIQDQP